MTKTTDPTAALEKTWSSTQEMLLSSLSRSDFYLELLIIGLAISVAIMVSLLIRRLATRKLAEISGKNSRSAFLLKPIYLLSPILSTLFLSIARPLAEQYANGSGWLVAMMQFCITWFFIRVVLLMVHNRGMAYFISVIIVAYAVLDITGFMYSTNELLGSMQFSLGKYTISMLNVIHGIIIFVLMFWLASALSRSLSVYLQERSSISYNARSLIVKFFTVLVYFIAFVITLDAVGVDLTALAVFGGALGVGIGLGLQKITSNFVSGVTILIEKSIKIGDLVEVEQFTGWVRQLNMRYALIETFDGREILVPNEQLISQRVTNWTYSNENARIEVRITINYNSDPEKARDMMLNAAREHPRCSKNPEAVCTFKEFNESGIVLALNFWVADVKEGRGNAQSDVMLAVLKRFKAGGIEMAQSQSPVQLVQDSFRVPADSLSALR